MTAIKTNIRFKINIKTSTLLLDFLNGKINKYREPQRRGTRKGEVIGLSLVKYIAALRSLYKVKIKDVAEQLGVSYGLLRKWRTEKVFKKQVASFEKEFAKVWCKYFWEHHTMNMDLDLTKKATTLQKSRTQIKRQEKRLSDIDQYSKSLTLAIQDEMKRAYMPKEGDAELVFLQKLEDLTSAIIELEPKGEFANDFKKVLRKAMKEAKKIGIAQCGKDVKNFIKKKNPTKAEREVALEQIEMILNFNKR